MDSKNCAKKIEIKRELIVRRTPQHNGVTEQKNRTIVEMAKSMLQGKKLPKILGRGC